MAAAFVLFFSKALSSCDLSLSEKKAQKIGENKLKKEDMHVKRKL